MAPPKFGDIGKKGSDLLSEDYKYDGKCEVKTKLENGVNVKTTVTRSDKDSSLAAVLELKKKVSVLDCTVKLDHKGAPSFVIEHGSLIPNLKLKGEAALNGASSKVSADYKHDSIMTSASVDTVKSVLALNSVVGFNAFALGVSSSYAFKGEAKWSTPAINAQYTGPSYEIATSIEGMGDKIGVCFHQNINKETDVALSLGQEKSSKGSTTNLALGASYKVDDVSNVKAKVDSNGLLSALYTQKIRPQMTLKITGQVNTAKLSQNNAHKIGLALLMDF